MQYHPHPIHDLKVKITDLELLLKFYVKVFRTSLFLNLVVYLVYIWYDDRYVSKFLCSTIPNPHNLNGQGQRLRIFMLKLYINVFRTSLFPNPVVYLFHVWCDDRCWSKVLCSTNNNPVHFCIDILCLSFYNVCFCEAFDGLIHVWHGDRNWSKILYGTISNPVHDL